MLSLVGLIAIFGTGKSWREDYSKDALGDQITSLPGLDTDTFKKYTMFSGYIDGMKYFVYYLIIIILKPKWLLLFWNQNEFHHLLHNINTVYPAHNRSIFYWFVESLNDPKSDPVAVWTNGGPGASGLLGMFTEQGPFRPLKNMSLRVQPYSWVNIANMIFIEAPAGKDDDHQYSFYDFTKIFIYI